MQLCTFVVALSNQAPKFVSSSFQQWHQPRVLLRVFASCEFWLHCALSPLAHSSFAACFRLLRFSVSARCAFSPLANFGFAARIPSSLRAFAYCEIRKVGSILLTCLSVFEAPLLAMVCDSPIIFVFGSGYACISGCTVFSG